MRALITGACGFVGGHLARHLLEVGDEVLGTVLIGTPASLQCETIQLDVTDSARCAETIRDFRPEVIYHLAGMAFVPEAEDDFQRALAVNVGSIGTLYSVCHLLEIPITILLVSSAEVYGFITPEMLPITEETPVCPANNYSLTKAMAELVPMRYGRSPHMRSVVMRPFNHIGPGQDDRFVTSSFARQLASMKARASEPVISVGNLEAKRDFADVRDVVRAYRLAAQVGGGVFQTSSGTSTSVREILETLIDISGLNVKVQTDPARMRPTEVPEIRGSFEKAKRELGWEPEIPLRQTLQDIYDYWLAIEQQE